MIFISNMPASQMEEAVLSRSLFIDIHLCASDTLKRIQSIAIAKAKKDGVSESEAIEILEALGGAVKTPTKPVTYMTAEYARKSKPLTVRSYGIAVKLKQAGLKDWARLSAIYG